MPYKDPDKRRAYLREYKRKNKDRLRPINADHDRLRNANRRAAYYGAPGRLAIEDVRAVMRAGRCYYCGSTDLLGIDHVVPLHFRGPNTRENLVCACRACNASKWRSPEPGRWARDHDACVSCGTQDAPHVARGKCNRCLQREAYAEPPRSGKIPEHLRIRESELQKRVVQYAQLRGWLHFHDYDSRHSTAGFPDLVLCRPPRLVFAELKSQGGRLRVEQKEFLDSIKQTDVEAYLWRPSDWDEIVEVLS